jgi:hypothetical protein
MVCGAGYGGRWGGREERRGGSPRSEVGEEGEPRRSGGRGGWVGEGGSRRSRKRRVEVRGEGSWREVGVACCEVCGFGTEGKLALRRGGLWQFTSRSLFVALDWSDAAFGEGCGKSGTMNLGLTRFFSCVNQYRCA